MDSAFCVAAHALVYLNHKACMLSSEELAENICTNSARVRKVMACLKRSGLVETKQGNVGGYFFTADPEKVTLAQVAEAVQVHFVEAGWHSGDSDMDCLVASGMAALMDGVFAELNKVCMEQLKHISIADLDHSIFKIIPNKKE